MTQSVPVPMRWLIQIKVKKTSKHCIEWYRNTGMELQRLQGMGTFSTTDAADFPEVHSNIQECYFPSSTTKANHDY